MIYDKRSSGGAGAKEKTKTLPEKSPDNGHSIILTWYARRNTTRLERAPRLITTQQIFNQQTQDIINQAIAKRRVNSGRPAARPGNPTKKRTSKGVRPSWVRRH